MELYDGRPENTDGRQDNEIRVYDLLDSLGIQYKRTDHEPATIPSYDVRRQSDSIPAHRKLFAHRAKEAIKHPKTLPSSRQPTVCHSSYTAETTPSSISFGRIVNLTFNIRRLSISSTSNS